MAGTKNGVLVGKNADFTQVDGPNAQSSEANGLATNGQLWIGTTAVNIGGTHVNVGTLTSPSGTITIGYASPNITLAAAGAVPTSFQADSGSATPSANILNVLGGPGVTTTASGNTFTVNSVVFTDQGGTTSVTSDSGSFATAAITLTLPAGPAQGELVEFVCTTANALVIDAPSTHLIRIGALISSAGGTATSTAIGNAVKLRYRAADTTWYAISVIGTWSMA